MDPVNKLTVRSNLKVGLAFGFSQFTQNAVIAVMFYVASIIIENGFDLKKKIFNVNPEHVFMALFAIMFGASHAGTA